MERVKILLREAKEEIGVDEDVNLRIIPMKYKIASLSLEKKVLRLNKNVVEKLDDEEIKYILLHELVHLKIKDVSHGSLFFGEIEKYFQHGRIREIEISIINKLLSRIAIQNL